MHAGYFLYCIVFKKGHDGKGSCSIEYGFEAHLHRPGLLNFDVKDNARLKVLGTPQQAGAALPVMAGPATQPVKYCCCFNRGRSVWLNDVVGFIELCARSCLWVKGAYELRMALKTICEVGPVGHIPIDGY